MGILAAGLLAMAALPAHAATDQPPSVCGSLAQPDDLAQERQWRVAIQDNFRPIVASPDGNLVLEGSALVQIDYRSFPGGQNPTNPGVVSARLVAQRLRPTVSGCLFREIGFQITPDFGNGLASPPNMFIARAEWNHFPLAQLGYGLQKIPVSVEVVQAIQNSPFMERSLVRNLAPLIAIGGTLSGSVSAGRLDYQVGFWNDAPSANIFQVGQVFSAPTTLSARIFAHPFRHDSTEWLRGLGVGIATTQGWIFDTAGQFPMQTETFSYTFFQLNGNVTGDGYRARYVPQATWYWKRVGFLGQYVYKHSKFRIINGPSANFASDAWSVQGSVMLSDDHAAFGQVRPRHPFSWNQPGHWGAWEFAARYSQIDLDPSTFSTGFADPGLSARRARSSTAALNWYLDEHVRLVTHFVHTDFTGATPAYVGASKEDALMFRLQLVY